MGFDGLSLYASFDNRTNHGNQHWINPYAASTTAGVTGITTTASAPLGLDFLQEQTRTIPTARSAPLEWTSQLTVRAEVYRKITRTSLSVPMTSLASPAPGALYVTGTIFRCHGKPNLPTGSSVLTLTTRFDAQDGRVRHRQFHHRGTGTEIAAGNASARTISEAWTMRLRQFYFHGDLFLCLQLSPDRVSVRGRERSPIPSHAHPERQQ